MYNVVIFVNGREVGIDADGTQHSRLEQAEVFTETEAHEVAAREGGRIVDAFDD